MAPAPTFEGWAMVELFGHRVLYGHFSEVTVCGATFARIDIPSDPPTFELKNASALYGIRPLTEDQVRRYHQPPTRLDRALASTSDAELVDDDFDADTGGVHDDGPDDEDRPLPPRTPALDPINPELGMQPIAGIDDDDEVAF